MDQRTLVVSCVEYYSDLKNIPSNKVFISPFSSPASLT